MNINKWLGIYRAVQGAAWSWNNICQMSSLVSWPVLLLSLTAGNVNILWLGIQTWLLHFSKGIWHIWEPCWETSGQTESTARTALFCPVSPVCYGSFPLWVKQSTGNVWTAKKLFSSEKLVYCKIFLWLLVINRIEEFTLLWICQESTAMQAALWGCI